MANYSGEYAQALVSLLGQLQNQGGNVNLANLDVNPQDMTQAGYPTQHGDYGTYMETFNNPQGTVAGNFTPVQRDANGNVSNILPEDEYIRYAEAVMGGQIPDYRKLQVGNTVTGNNAIDRAAQQGIRQADMQNQYANILRMAGLAQ
jgi:hypothetical protein